MNNFRQVDRQTGFLLPPSVDEWLPERHLARFVVEVIEQLDLSAMVKAYRGSGSASYHPSVLLGLLVYGYATGVFSSRKLECQCRSNFPQKCRSKIPQFRPRGHYAPCRKLHARGGQGDRLEAARLQYGAP
ncbi:transposase, partial [Mesorhizobium sp. M0243]|uniref:transposase n=1 Tax=Mesorhizobium sp. M0243 TaxID=2956925 RepID=UPI003337F941